MKTSIRFVLMVVVVLGLIGAAWAGDGCGGKNGGCKGKASCAAVGQHGAKDAKTEAGTIPYTMDKCIVSGEKLGGMGDPVVKVYDGREVKFCCNGCVSKFEKDKASYFTKMDDAIVAAQKPTYALTTCVVSGEKLDGGEMKPVDYVYRNQLVRFCCNGCISTFEKNPDKYLAMLHPAKAMDKAESKTEVKTETKTETAK
jgi:YHS domain-containing protein